MQDCPHKETTIFSYGESKKIHRTVYKYDERNSNQNNLFVYIYKIYKKATIAITGFNAKQRCGNCHILGV